MNRFTANRCFERKRSQICNAFAILLPLVRPAPMLAALAAASQLTACNEGERAARAQDAECAVRVVVGLVAEPDDVLFADLERANALELEPLSSVTNDLRVFTLHTAGSDDECLDAIERLRRDARVRSVDIDTRRELHDE